jgi:hypothetical protein
MKGIIVFRAEFDALNIISIEFKGKNSYRNEKSNAHAFGMYVLK